jgi:hypothetical protein
MKDYLRDYATAAFRFYAKNGMSAEKYKENIYNQAMEDMKKREIRVKDGISKPTEAAITRAENAVDEKIAELKDIEAVEKVLAELKGTRRAYIVQAIEIVYFNEPGKDIELGDIQDRVNVATIAIPASQRSIYYWLRQARELFAYQRGLRV